MDADQIRRLKPMLTGYLRQLDDCFARRDARSHFTTYVNGQLPNLGEKSCEPIALAAGIPPRNLRGFLAFYHWNEDLACNTSSSATTPRRMRSASSMKPAT
jgi:hypothetical protein